MQDKGTVSPQLLKESGKQKSVSVSFVLFFCATDRMKSVMDGHE